MPENERDGNGLPRRARILLVDDERDLVDAYTRLLARAGFDCLGAFDHEQAIARIDAEAFDLMITDLSLPRRSGLEIIRRARDGSRPVPVIVMTGHNTPDLAAAARDAGADTCLLKPVSITELTRVIRETLARHSK
jgi:two-component system, OmpR family, response regulator QseB